MVAFITCIYILGRFARNPSIRCACNEGNSIFCSQITGTSSVMSVSLPDNIKTLEETRQYYVEFHAILTSDPEFRPHNFGSYNATVPFTSSSVTNIYCIPISSLCTTVTTRLNTVLLPEFLSVQAIQSKEWDGSNAGQVSHL